MDESARLNAIDRATLTPVVRRVLGDYSAEVVDWGVCPVQGGIVGPKTGSSAVHRVAGTAHVGGEQVPWSVILKLSRVAKREPDLHAWLWNAEPFLYESGILDYLPGDFRAPRCFGVDQREEDLYWIWLEDVAEDGDRDWPLERYALAARHLGQLNGAFLVARPLPDYPWVTRGFYRAWTRMGLQMVGMFPDVLRDHRDDPLVRRACPPDLGERVLALWDDLPRFLDALDRLPQTFCHLDAFRRNLIARRTSDGRDQTVGIDWPTAGIAAVGIETAPMIQLASQHFESLLARDASALEELESAIFEGYLAGLRDVGWEGDWRLPRLGHLIGLAFRTGSSPAIVCQLLDPTQRVYSERRIGRSAEEIADRCAATGRLGLRAADEARELLPLVD